MIRCVCLSHLLGPLDCTVKAGMAPTWCRRSCAARQMCTVDWKQPCTASSVAGTWQAAPRSARQQTHVPPSWTTTLLTHTVRVICRIGHHMCDLLPMRHCVGGWLKPCAQENNMEALVT